MSGNAEREEEAFWHSPDCTCGCKDEVPEPDAEETKRLAHIIEHTIGGPKYTAQAIQAYLASRQSERELKFVLAISRCLDILYTLRSVRGIEVSPEGKQTIAEAEAALRLVDMAALAEPAAKEPK